MEIKNRKKGSWTKKIGFGFVALIFIFVLAAFIVPYFFKDKIIGLVKTEINKNLKAKTDFKDVSLSLFRSFPDINVGIDDVTILGIDHFSKDTLAHIDKLSLDIDVWSFLSSSKSAQINFFSLVKPIINLIILEDGSTNFDILKSNDQADNPKSKDISLEKYSIESGTVNFIDKQNLSEIHLTSLNHTGKGNFKSQVFDLVTKTTIDNVTYLSSGIPYVKDMKLDCDLDIGADLNNMVFKIGKNSLKLNDLIVNTVGEVAMKEDNIELNLNFKAPGNNFKELFSLVPNAYIENYKDVKIDGTFGFSGFIKGSLNSQKDIFPSFDFKINANNGYVKYPNLEIPIDKINANIRLYNELANIDDTKINIDPLTFTLADEPFILKVLVGNVTGDISTSGIVKGILDLKKLSKAFPMHDIKNIEGKIVSDVTFAFNKSMTQKNIKGNAAIEQLTMNYSDLPILKINTVNINFNNELADCKNLSGSIGKSDFAGNVKIISPLNYLTDKNKVTINIDGQSKFFNADEFISNSSPKQETPANSSIDAMLNKFIFNFKYSIGKLQFEDYDLANINVSGSLQNNKLNFNNSSFVFFGSRIGLQGYLENLVNWATLNQEMSGKMSIVSPAFDMDRYMSSSTSKTKISKPEPFEMPDNMNFTIDANLTKVTYSGKTLNNVKGSINVMDQKAQFDDVTASGMGGNLKLSGVFAAQKSHEPNYDVKFSIVKMRYEDVFTQVVTANSLAPIGQYLNGIFNADFTLKGTMDGDLNPKLESVNGTGLIQTINAYMKSFMATHELANKLNIKSLENVKLQNTKSYFEIKNGALTINPFDVKIEDMSFNIGGTNSLDKNIDYIIHAKIPRAKFDKIPGGQNLNNGINYISGLAKSKGLDINAGEFINLDFLIKGPITKPNVKVEYKGNEGNAIKSAVESKVNSVVQDAKTKANDELNKAKMEAENKAKVAADSLKRLAEKKAKETSDEIKKKAEQELKNRLDSATQKKAKDVLDKYNPFKKKK